MVAETRTLPSDVLGNGRSLKAVKAGGRIGASAAPCECIPRQQHDARAVGFCRHKLRPPAAAGCGDLVQYASGQCPPSRGHDGKWITKDRATRVPRPLTVTVIVMSFDLRLAVKGMAPLTGSVTIYTSQSTIWAEQCERPELVTPRQIYELPPSLDPGDHNVDRPET